MERFQRSFGPYEIVARIGRGGMAEIFLARAKGPGGFQKIVALKCIHPHLSDDEAFRMMLLDEARLAAGLDHPAIVQIHALGEEDATFFIAMEYVPGQPLHRLIRKLRHGGRRLVAKLALRIVIPIAEALAFAHERKDLKGRPLGIVHRDVSPQNILVGYDGTVKLTDFGIAKAEGRTLDTTGDAVKGKVAYMAPEQVHAETLDGRADVFALGIVLFELLTGQSPFRANNEEPLATMRRIAEHDPPAPSALAPELGPDIDAIVAKALAKRKDQRYATARELGEALERYAHSLGPASSGELGALMHDLFGQEIDDLENVLRGMDDPSRLTRMPSLGSRSDLPAASVLTLPDTAVARPASKLGDRASSVPPPSTLPLAGEPAAGEKRPSAPPGDTIASHGKWVNYSHAPVPQQRGGFWVLLALAAALLAGGVVFGLSGMGLLSSSPTTTSDPAPAPAPVAAAAPAPAPVAVPGAAAAPVAAADPGAVADPGPGPGPGPSTSDPSPRPSPRAGERGNEAGAGASPPDPSPRPSPRAGERGNEAGAGATSPDPSPRPSPRAGERGNEAGAGERGSSGGSGSARVRQGSAVRAPSTEAPAAPAATSTGGTGRITLDADPWAQVYVDGRLIGPTPLFEHRVPAGTVTIRLVNPQLGADRTLRIEVPRDGLVRRRVSLRDESH